MEYRLKINLDLSNDEWHKLEPLLGDLAPEKPITWGDGESFPIPVVGDIVHYKSKEFGHQDGIVVKRHITFLDFEKGQIEVLVDLKFDEAAIREINRSIS